MEGDVEKMREDEMAKVRRERKTLE